MNKSEIEKLANRLAGALPEGLRSMRDELADNFKTTLSDGLAKLDLVTREEFEVQEAVLKRTREKLDRLEKQLAELEADEA